MSTPANASRQIASTIEVDLKVMTDEEFDAYLNSEQQVLNKLDAEILDMVNSIASSRGIANAFGAIESILAMVNQGTKDLKVVAQFVLELAQWQEQYCNADSIKAHIGSIDDVGFTLGEITDALEETLPDHEATTVMRKAATEVGRRFGQANNRAAAYLARQVSAVKGCATAGNTAIAAGLGSSGQSETWFGC